MNPFLPDEFAPVLDKPVFPQPKDVAGRTVAPDSELTDGQKWAVSYNMKQYKEEMGEYRPLKELANRFQPDRDDREAAILDHWDYLRGGPSVIPLTTCFNSQVLC